MPRPALRRYFRHGLFPQLMVFETVARLRSVTRAAEELHLAQPTVSTQLRKLSDTLGLALFEQRGRSLEPTAAGGELRVTCEELIALLERIEARLAPLRTVRPDVLRLGAVPGAQGLAARLIAAYCLRHPGASVDLHVAGHEAILARLLSGKDDLCLHPASGEDPGLAMSPIVALDAQGFPLLREWRIGRRKATPLPAPAELFLREAVENPEGPPAAGTPITAGQAASARLPSAPGARARSPHSSIHSPSAGSR
jgi:LysR family transcriptional regulator, low CO2-responsive transcriptional regulator